MPQKTIQQNNMTAKCFVCSHIKEGGGIFFINAIHGYTWTVLIMQISFLKLKKDPKDRIST
jgi:hypothetical protein